MRWSIASFYVITLVIACANSGLAPSREEVLEEFGLKDGDDIGCSWNISRIEKIDNQVGRFVVGDQELHSQVTLDREGGVVAILKTRSKSPYKDPTFSGLISSNIRSDVTGWLGHGEIICDNGERFKSGFFVDSFGKPFIESDVR